MINIPDQSIITKFCVKLGKSFTETHQMMQNTYGDQCLEHTHYYNRCKRFKDSRESIIDDDSRSERPLTSTDGAHVTKVNKTKRSNRRLTLRKIAEDCNISVGS